MDMILFDTHQAIHDEEWPVGAAGSWGEVRGFPVTSIPPVVWASYLLSTVALGARGPRDLQTADFVALKSEARGSV